MLQYYLRENLSLSNVVSCLTTVHLLIIALSLINLLSPTYDSLIAELKSLFARRHFVNASQ